MGADRSRSDRLQLVYVDLVRQADGEDLNTGLLASSCLGKRRRSVTVGGSVCDEYIDLGNPRSGAPRCIEGQVAGCDQGIGYGCLPAVDVQLTYCVDQINGVTKTVKIDRYIWPITESYDAYLSLRWRDRERADDLYGKTQDADVPVVVSPGSGRDTGRVVQ